MSDVDDLARVAREAYMVALNGPTASTAWSDVAEAVLASSVVVSARAVREFLDGLDRGAALRRDLDQYSAGVRWGYMDAARVLRARLRESAPNDD